MAMRHLVVGVALALAFSGCGGSSSGTTVVIHGSASQRTVVPMRVPSTAMEPTLAVGQIVHVAVTGYVNRSPKVGDIVVFHPPQGATSSPAECGAPVSTGQMCDAPTPQESTVDFIKRIVAGPGDTIQIINGHVIRNGKPEGDSYIRPCAGGEDCTFSGPITIPPDHWFVLGDNRGQSDDSRFWGPVPTSWLVGPTV